MMLNIICNNRHGKMEWLYFINFFSVGSAEIFHIPTLVLQMHENEAGWKRAIFFLWLISPSKNFDLECKDAWLPSQNELYTGISLLQSFFSHTATMHFDLMLPCTIMHGSRTSWASLYVFNPQLWCGVEIYLHSDEIVLD